MSKSKNTVPYWVRNLRVMMEAQNFNPRSLSLKSGLNATAVRDMLEGRTKFPRYDTAMALSRTLNTTPARLMAERGAGKDEEFGEEIELLTEIISRFLELADEKKHKPKPRDFAAMVATAYRKLMETGEWRRTTRAIGTQVHELFDYELLRNKKRG